MSFRNPGADEPPPGRDPDFGRDAWQLDVTVRLGRLEKQLGQALELLERVAGRPPFPSADGHP